MVLGQTDSKWAHKSDCPGLVLVARCNLQNVNKVLPEALGASLGKAAQELHEKEVGVGNKQDWKAEACSVERPGAWAPSAAGFPPWPSPARPSPTPGSLQLLLSSRAQLMCLPHPATLSDNNDTSGISLDHKSDALPMCRSSLLLCLSALTLRTCPPCGKESVLSLLTLPGKLFTEKWA